MSGFRGIFLDSIHPLITKRLDHDTLAFRGRNIPTGDGSMLLNEQYQGTVGAPLRYFQERTAWIRTVPFAIPQVEMTVNPRFYVDLSELPQVPDWRDYIIWGGKAIQHGGEGYTFSSNSNTAGIGEYDSALYRQSGESWRGVDVPGLRNSPLPGIVNLNVSNKGDLGTIRRASLDIKVHNIVDLEAMEMMYMIPGITVLVEWGWFHPSHYMDPIDVEMIKDGGALNTTTLVQTEILKRSFGIETPPGQEGDPTPLYNLEEVGNKPLAEFGQYGPKAGIYDGLLGVVTKFNWSNDGQGGYDCRIDIISPGSLTAGIPAESFTIGGAIEITTAKGTKADVQVSDMRTLLSLLKIEARAISRKLTESNKGKSSKNRQSNVKFVGTETGKATYTDGGNGVSLQISPRKINTSTYGVSIKEENGELVVDVSKNNSSDDKDYFVGEYKGGKRQKVNKIYGDRTWWNKVLYEAIAGHSTAKNSASWIKKWRIKNLSLSQVKSRGKAGTLDMTKITKPWGKKLDEAGLDDLMYETTAEKMGINDSGTNDREYLSALEYYCGDALRAGRFYINKNGVMFTQKNNDTTSYYNDFDDGRLLNNKWANWSKTAAGYPKMEQIDQEHIELGKRKLVKNITKIKGSVIMSQNDKEAAAAKYGWTKKDNNYVDQTGKQVQWQSGQFQSVTTVDEGVTVYSKDESGNFVEVASFEGNNISEEDILKEIQNKARGFDNSEKKSRNETYEEEKKVDAEILGKASNFGSVSWATSTQVENGDLPFAYDDNKTGKLHKRVYCTGYPVFAPKVLGDHTEELGYEFLDGTEPAYPIGYITYGQTYVYWRFIEDYIINELYMPKAVSPSKTEGENTTVTTTLETLFRSCEQMSDLEKIKLKKSVKDRYGLTETNGVLDEESRNKPMFKPTYIINHKDLRSFNPEVCILPGQESIPPLAGLPDDVKQQMEEDGIEIPEQPSVVAMDVPYMLDGDGEGNGLKDANPEMQYKNCINSFAGFNEAGEKDQSRGILRNILINVDFIEEVAEKTKTIKDFCLSILNEVNKACGEPWSFKVLTNSALGKMSVIDENFTPEEKVTDYGLGWTYSEGGVYFFTGIGSDNILKDVKIQSKIPNELQTMAYYSTLGSDNSKGSGIQMFQMYGIGIADRLKSITQVTVLGNNTGSELSAMQADADLLRSYIQTLPKTRQALANGEEADDIVNEGMKAAKNFVKKYIHGDTVECGSYRPPIPIDVSMDLHGVSGIYMGNAIGLKTVADGGILPNRYKNTVALQVTSVDHTVTPEGWGTSLGTLMRPIIDTENPAVAKVTPREGASQNINQPEPYARMGNPFGAGEIYKINSFFGNKEEFRKSSHGGVDFNNANNTKLYNCLPTAKVTYRVQTGNKDSKSANGLPLGKGHGYGYYVRLEGKSFDGKENMLADYGHLNGYAVPGLDQTSNLDWDELYALAEKNPSILKIQSKKAIRLVNKSKFGDLLAYSGGTRGAKGAGNSGGPHLHLTIKSGGTKVNPQDYVQDYIGEYGKQPPGRNRG